MPSFFQIVAHTPTWVWAVLAYLVVDGLFGLRSSTRSPWRLLILPMVGIGLSLAGLGQAARSDIAFAAWVVALLSALPLGYAIGRRRAIRRLEDGRLETAGGWFGLLFGLAIFSVRYALGVLFALQPALKPEPFWIALSNGIGGMVAGIGLGWLAGVLLRVYGLPGRHAC